MQIRNVLSVLSITSLVGLHGMVTWNTPAALGSTGDTFSLCGYEYQANCVVDGDTIHYRGAKIRLLGIDAPEVRDYKCAAERALGQRAKMRLMELLNAGPFELVADGDRDTDRFGRQLRHINRNGRSLGDILIAEGLAARWEGHHHYWCGY